MDGELLNYQVSTENSNSSYHIKAFIYKNTQHNMTSKFLKKWQLFKKSFPLNTCCHGLMPLTLRLAPSSSAARLQHTQKGPHNKRISSFQKFSNRYISLINNGTATFSTDIFIHICQQW